jgi:hypothetical protein
MYGCENGCENVFLRGSAAGEAAHNRYDTKLNQLLRGPSIEN